MPPGPPLRQTQSGAESGAVGAWGAPLGVPRRKVRMPAKPHIVHVRFGHVSVDVQRFLGFEDKLITTRPGNNKALKQFDAGPSQDCGFTSICHNSG